MRKIFKQNSKSFNYVITSFSNHYCRRIKKCRQKIVGLSIYATDKGLNWWYYSCKSYKEQMF